jgi:capsular exopolysaccharide synthesis family protein
VDTVSTVPDASAELVWVETTGSSKEAAAAAANAVATAAEAEGYRKANQQADDAIRRTRDSRDQATGARRAEADTARRTRETARTSAGSENLELDVRKLQEDLLTHETRRRDLDRTIRANRFNLERVRADRAAAEHFIRETVPRLGTASIQARVAENARVKTVSERLENLHRELLLLRRKYTEEHPQVKNVRSDLLETEVELTRTQIQALGFDMDKEELDLRTKNELVAIELRVLEPELRDIKARLDLLNPFLDTAKTHESRAVEIGLRVNNLQTLLDQLETAARDKGYIIVQQPANRDEAALIPPRLMKSWPVAILISLVLGVSIAFLRDFIDTSLRTDFDVRRHLDYPVLAVIPRVASAEIRALWRTGPVSEMFDTLGTVLLSLPADRACRILLVTSTNPEEGKTAVSTNLAVALARQGKRTLLIDADMRLPSIHAILGLENTLGLADVLSGSSPVGTPGLLQEIEGTHLKVLPSGVPPENPYELLDPGRVTALLAPFRDQFDVVVIDTPPVLRAGDALKLSSVADQTLFVVESGKTDVRQATWAKRLLGSVSARVAGVVLNRAAEESEEYYYYRGTREPLAGESRRESRRL